ncbi:HAD-IA family hydrolase [Herbiconiux sp. CPCC 203407]|uniref:HAD-IA family hydrolase n=1 Tax=Herbiconiux oxytropis TaxID=2970915 RepID=A0AA42BVN3_9MICO|nr:HAD-IA family hydrolase [Herbiconiux oxytropis]MCS5721679.1 HAD-IA family hydrolase [Herbiconiux oxytropis]MCS5726694.1 HAD-IA family hydrolase [Herbiconiux oxytropis]
MPCWRALYQPAMQRVTDIVELVHAWHRPPPWPDSVPGLRALKADYIIGPLSNAHTALLLEMSKSRRLPWDVIIGSDITRTYKPDPAAYRKTVELLGLPPGEVMLVAAHNEDLQAARMSGLATTFIARPREHGSRQVLDLEPTSDWDVVADDIEDLARRLRRRGR